MERDDLRLKVIVFGATGNTGRCLTRAGVALGHDVTIFVRDISKLKLIFDEDLLSRVRICEGDALDEWAVAQAMTGQNAAVNAAQHRTNPEVFMAICLNIVTQAEHRLLAPRRLWLFGGLPGLDVPHTKIIGSDLPGLPPILRSHKANYELLKKSSLDWSFMCPGPMTFDPDRNFGERLRITTEVMPYRVGSWTGHLPRLAHPFIMMRHLNEVTVSYDDVANLVMSNLAPNGPFSKKRVGVGAPFLQRNS
jgi:putative NADH-flavin reductase